MVVLVLVFSFQFIYMFKFLGVVCDNNQFLVVCVIGNYLIEWFDRVFLMGKFCFDLFCMGGGWCVIIQNIKLGNKFFYYSEIFFGYLVFFGIVNQFYQGD